MASTRIAIVTGGNTGIGYEIVKRLIKDDSNLKVVFTSRDDTKGKQALASFNNERVECLRLDIDSKESIKSFAQEVAQRYPGIDILINNAGMAFKGSRFDEEVVSQTVKTNYYGTMSLTNELLPLLRDNARIVNVSSTAGSSTLAKCSKEIQDRFRAPNLTLEQIDQLYEEFLAAVKDGTYEQKGFTSSGYGFSKLLLTMGTRVLARLYSQGQLERCRARGLQITAICPGWCRTNMTGDKAPRSAEEGADTPCFVALSEANPAFHGAFVQDRKILQV